MYNLVYQKLGKLPFVAIDNSPPAMIIICIHNHNLFINLEDHPLPGNKSGVRCLFFDGLKSKADEQAGQKPPG
jgi:hypothetical protein